MSDNIVTLPISPQESTLKCSICGGPINNGEPVVIYHSQEEGTIINHRFKTTCAAHIN